MRRYTRHATPVHILVPTVRGNTYQTNNLMTKNVEENEHTIEYTTEQATVLGHIFAQTYSLTKGIKIFGNKGLYGVFPEVKKLNDRTCFRPIDVKNITSQELQLAMEPLMLLT